MRKIGYYKDNNYRVFGDPMQMIYETGKKMLSSNKTYDGEKEKKRGQAPFFFTFFLQHYN